MATVNVVRVNSASHDGGVGIFEWAHMKLNDVGQALTVPAHADKTWDVGYGTLGQAGYIFGSGGTVTIEGSNELPADPIGALVNPKTLHDPATVALTLTSGATSQCKQQLENPYLVAPKISAGDGTTDLTVRLIVKR